MDKLSSCIVREGALDVRDAVGWVVRVATALQSVHVSQRAHGRISAKAVQVARPSCAAAGFLTVAEELSDQPAYQSPERLAGEGASAEDDTWALGVLLFEGLTGNLPFPGADAKEVKARIRTKPQPLASAGLNEPDLQAVLDDMFVLDRSRRLHTVHHVLSRLLELHPEVSLLPPLMLGREERSSELDEETEQAAGRAAAPAAEEDELPTVQVVLSKELTNSLAKAAKAATAAKTAKKAAAAAAAPGANHVSQQVSQAAKQAAEVAQAAADVAKRAAQAMMRPAPEPVAAKPPGRLPEELGPALVTPPSSRPGTAPASAPAASRAASVEPAPAAPKKGRLRDALLVAGCLGLGGLIGFFVLQRLGAGPGAAPSADAVSGPAASGASATASAAAADRASAGGAVAPSSTASASAAASAPSSGAPSAAASSSATAGAQAGAPRDVGACMQQLFPSDTFAQTPNLDFVCSEIDPYKGGVTLRVKVIRAGGAVGGVTGGMHEWSMLGWYEMAAFAIGRALCCPNAAPLKSTHRIDTCPLSERLTALGAAAIGPDDAAVDSALKDYVAVLRCLVAAGTASTFGQPGPPDPGSVTTFRKTLDRVRKVVKR